MKIRSAKIASDLRLFEACGVGKERGRRRLQELEAQGLIKPKRTPTGRNWLSMQDAETLADNL